MTKPHVNSIPTDAAGPQPRPPHDAAAGNVVRLPTRHQAPLDAQSPREIGLPTLGEIVVASMLCVAGGAMFLVYGSYALIAKETRRRLAKRSRR